MGRFCSDVSTTGAASSLPVAKMLHHFIITTITITITGNIIIVTLTIIGIQFKQKTILARMPGVVSIGGLEIRMKGEKKRAMRRMQFAAGIHKKTRTEIHKYTNTNTEIQKFNTQIQVQIRLE